MAKSVPRLCYSVITYELFGTAVCQPSRQLQVYPDLAVFSAWNAACPPPTSPYLILCPSNKYKA